MRQIFRRALNQITQIPSLAFAAALSLWVATLLLGAILLVQHTVTTWSQQLTSHRSLMVYFAPEVEQNHAEKLRQRLASLQGVDRVLLYSPEVLEKQLAPLLGNEFLPDGSAKQLLTFAAEVYATEPSQLHNIAAEITYWHEVEEVDDAEELFLRLQHVEQLLRILSIGFEVLIAVVAMFIISMTVSLALYAQRDKLAIEKLIGASDGFILLPLLIESTMLAGVGTSLALMSLRLSWHFSAKYFSLRLVQTGLLWPTFFSWREGMMLCFVIWLIALMGTWIGAFHHLRNSE